jgi:hypothetical protein
MIEMKRLKISERILMERINFRPKDTCDFGIWISPFFSLQFPLLFLIRDFAIKTCGVRKLLPYSTKKKTVAPFKKCLN